MLSIRIVLDEEKILKNGKYKLEELYAYLDETAQKTGLIRVDKNNYIGKGDAKDLSRVGIFTLCNAVKNEAITKNVKEWLWLDDNKCESNIITESKENGVGIWE